jgi:hypothetical protein
MKTMVSSAGCFCKKCEELASNSKSTAIKVQFSKQFQELVLDVISRTAFGSSYRMGQELFHGNSFRPFMWQLSSCIHWVSSKSIYIARVMIYI